MQIKIGYRIRENNYIRILCIPIIQIRRYFGMKKYKTGNDAKYLRSLKNKYKGERCFIIGNGPSLNEHDLEMISNEKSIAFNYIFNIYQNTSWRPYIYMAADTVVLESLRDKDFTEIGAEIVLVASRSIAKKWRERCNIHQMYMYGKNTINKEKLVMKEVSKEIADYFTINQSVSCNAMELAFYMGFKEIFLLGFDHSFRIEVDMNGKRKVDKNIRSHFEGYGNIDAVSRKDALTRCYQTCKAYADKHNIRVINVTRGGKLEVFERKRLEDVLEYWEKQ